jgi:hypothetical protein
VLAALFCTISLTMAVILSRSSTQPENDLGVVGSSQPAPQVQNTVEENVISVGSDESEGSDLPSFDTATNEVSGSGVINSNAADDLPALNTTATEASESAVTEEAQAVEDGSGGEGSVPDDS